MAVIMVAVKTPLTARRKTDVVAFIPEITNEIPLTITEMQSVQVRVNDAEVMAAINLDKSSTYHHHSPLGTWTTLVTV